MFPISLNHTFASALPGYTKDLSIAENRVMLRAALDEAAKTLDRDKACEGLRSRMAIRNRLLQLRAETMHRESETGFSTDGDESFYFDGLRDSRVSFFMTTFRDDGDLNCERYTAAVQKQCASEFDEYLALVKDLDLTLNKIVDLLISANPMLEAFLRIPCELGGKRRLLMENVERLVPSCGLSMPLVVSRYLACVRFNYPIWVRGLAAVGSYGTLHSIGLRLRSEVAW